MTLSKQERQKRYIWKKHYTQLKENEQPHSVEKYLYEQGYKFVIGTDETGMGCLAGPVYAAACCFLVNPFDEEWHKYVCDSKKLTREKHAMTINNFKPYVEYAVTFDTAKNVDRLGVRRVAVRCMDEAVEEVKQKLYDKYDITADAVIYDGNYKHDGVKTYDFRGDQLCVSLPRADKRSITVAAASIISKYERDSYMIEQAEAYPEYGFDKHKGYGTQQHRDALKKHGHCLLHRLTVKGVLPNA